MTNITSEQLKNIKYRSLRLAWLHKNMKEKMVKHARILMSVIYLFVITDVVVSVIGAGFNSEEAKWYLIITSITSGITAVLVKFERESQYRERKVHHSVAMEKILVFVEQLEDTNDQYEIIKKDLTELLKQFSESSVDDDIIQQWNNTARDEGLETMSILEKLKRVGDVIKVSGSHDEINDRDNSFIVDFTPNQRRKDNPAIEFQLNRLNN